jgi:hypothetical protein
VVWWEVWLRVSDGREVDRLRTYAALANLAVGERQLVFDNRVIVLLRASARQFGSALDIIDDFAELRAAHTNSSFFTHPQRERLNSDRAGRREGLRSVDLAPPFGR